MFPSFGGYVRGGTDFVQTAIREVREETRYKKMWFVYRDGEFAYQCFGKDQVLKFIRRKLSGKRHALMKKSKWTYGYGYNPVSVARALKAINLEIKEMTVAERWAELDKNRDSEFVHMMHDLREFLTEFNVEPQTQVL